MANFASLLLNRLPDTFPARFIRVKQVVVIKPPFLEQTIHCPCVRLERPVGQNVGDIDAAPVEFMSNEERSMTVQRFPFRAHQRNAVFPGAPQQPVDAIAKVRRIREVIVTDVAIFVIR